MMATNDDKEAGRKLSAARDQTNPLQPFAPFQKFHRNGLKVDITCERIDLAGEDVVPFAFGLVKENMEEFYAKSSLGWSDKKKKREMMEDATFFLLATDENGERVGFVSFQFDFDEGIEVIYCYEIQLCQSVRGKGLGKFLMQVLQLIGAKAHMKKCVLTVFKANDKAVSFFKGLKFAVDETDPSMDDEDTDYEILSKSLQKK